MTSVIAYSYDINDKWKEVRLQYILSDIQHSHVVLTKLMLNYIYVYKAYPSKLADCWQIWAIIDMLSLLLKHKSNMRQCVVSLVLDKSI